jgi:hypothetical protein
MLMTACLLTLLSPSEVSRPALPLCVLNTQRWHDSLSMPLALLRPAEVAA